MFLNIKNIEKAKAHKAVTGKTELDGILCLKII